jgi:hypothetical protein
MNRRGFLRALTGALALPWATKAIALRPPQSIEKFTPEELTVAAVNWAFLGFLAQELQRQPHTDKLHRRPLAHGVEVVRFGRDGYQQMTVSFEFQSFPRPDELRERYLKPSAEWCATRLHDEAERGGRGLRMYPLPVVQQPVSYDGVDSPWKRFGPRVCHVAEMHSVASRFVSATNYSVVHDGVVTFGRFDLAYAWEQRQPRRPRKRFAYDPARLPA